MDDISVTSLVNRSRLKIRERKIRQLMKRFRRKISHQNLIETERDVILPVLRHLNRNDLLNCMVVSKNWNSKC